MVFNTNINNKNNSLIVQGTIFLIKIFNKYLKKLINSKTPSSGKW